MAREQNPDTRINILGSAAYHFAKFGYKGASMAKIAAQAGVSKSLIFWYFQSKGKLLESLMDDFVDRCMKTLLLDNKEKDPHRKIVNLIDIYWDFVKKNLQFIQVFMSWFIQLGTDEKQKIERLQKIHDKFEEVFRGYLQEGIEEGIFSKDLNVQATAKLIVSNLEGVLIQIFILKSDLNALDRYFFQTLKENIFCGILIRKTD